MSAEIRQLTLIDPILIKHLGNNPDLQDSSAVWAGFWEGELVVLWGIVPASLLSDRAYIWSVTTPAVSRCKKSFFKLSHAWVKGILDDYPLLVGYCDCKTSWLKHLGAVFVDKHGPLFTFIIRA